MATRKQKHARAIEKREQYMEAYRNDGLKALRREKARRFKEKLKEWEKIHKEKHTSHVDECPHCQVIKTASKKKDKVDA